MSAAEFAIWQTKRDHPVRALTSEGDQELARERVNKHEDNRTSPGPEPESPVQHEPVAAQAGEAKNPSRIHVRITSFRCRLLDPDNLCPKYFVDCLRYAGLIPDDRAQDIALEVRQEKVSTRAQERTVIEIEGP